MAEADFDKALQAAGAGDWDSMVAHAKLAPASWDVWQQLPSAAMKHRLETDPATGKQYSVDEGGLPNEAVHKILDHLVSRPRLKEELLPSFLFEYASNLPDHADEKVLNRVAGFHEEGGGFVQQRVEEHPNWKPDQKTAGMKGVADFWQSYERKVEPHHFATVKSMYTGKPEEIVDHRGGAGRSHDHMHLLEHMGEYARMGQEEVMKDWREWPWEQESHSSRHLVAKPGEPWYDEHPRVRIKYFNGQPHVH